MRMKYVVELTGEERERLGAIVRAERTAAHKRKHAQMLLKAVCLANIHPD